MRGLQARVAGLCWFMMVLGFPGISLAQQAASVPANTQSPSATSVPAASPNPPTPQNNAAGADSSQNPKSGDEQEGPQINCTGKTAAECGVSQEDFNKARETFSRAQSLRKKGEFDRALEAYEEAARLVPRDAQFATERELLRQQLAYEHTQVGADLMSQGRTIEAADEFRKALQMDPGNQFVADQLHEIAGRPAAPFPTYVESESDGEDVVLRPAPVPQDLSLNDDARGAFTKAAGAFGITVEFDESATTHHIHLDLTRVSFSAAMDALSLVSKNFWTPVTPTEILVAADKPDKHKALERWLLRTFYLPEPATAQEMTEIVNLLRTLFELRFVTPAPGAYTISVRGPARVVEAATQFLQTLWAGRPQVVIDLEVYSVSHQMMRTLGLSLPLQFNAFNIPAGALAALGTSNIQNLINQVIASGGLNSAGAQSTIAGLLAQLQQQNMSLFQNPVATFGGGLTLFGIGVTPLTANLSLNESWVNTLEKVSLHVAQNNSATFRLGTRYPILSSSFSSVVNVPQQFSSLLGGSSANNAALNTYPSFTYEDLGLTLKAKPIISGDSNVTLDLEVEIRSLSGTSLNGAPILSSQSYKGMVSVRNGEPAVVAGAITHSDQQSLQGIPGLGSIPIVGLLGSNRTKSTNDEELLMLITPHISSAAPEHSTPAIEVPRAQ